MRVSMFNCTSVLFGVYYINFITAILFFFFSPLEWLISYDVENDTNHCIERLLSVPLFSFTLQSTTGIRNPNTPRMLLCHLNSPVAHSYCRALHTGRTTSPVSLPQRPLRYYVIQVLTVPSEISKFLFYSVNLDATIDVDFLFLFCGFV